MWKTMWKTKFGNKTRRDYLRGIKTNNMTILTIQQEQTIERNMIWFKLAKQIRELAELEQISEKEVLDSLETIIQIQNKNRDNEQTRIFE